MTGETESSIGAPSQRSGEVIDLRTRRSYRPHLGSVACQQVGSARRRIGLSASEFAEVLTPLLGWTPSAETIQSWETNVVPPGDVLLAVGLAAQAASPQLETGAGPEHDLLAEMVARRYADVEAVFPTRSEFASKMPPHTLFDSATEIRAAGLSLNILCQQYADENLRHLVESGTVVRCLFLNPEGDSIKAREREEGYRQGFLSALNDLNIQILDQRVRQRLPEGARSRLQIAVYDEPIRFNITIIDSTLAVVQPYLHAARGIEAPTFVIRNDGTTAGLFPTFEQTFAWLWDRGTPV